MRITALKQRLAAVTQSMDGILATAAARPEGEQDLSAEETAEFEKFEAEAKQLQASIAREERILELKASAARPVQEMPGGPSSDRPTAPAQPVEKGITFARMTRALAAAKGIPIVAQQIAESWGDSGLFANQNMGSGGAGGFLVPEDVSTEIIELLRPQSVIMSSNPIVVPMPNANMTMGRQATGSNASYIGEQQNAPATGVTFGQVKLSAKKLAALVPISNDLLRAASVAADRVVRDDLTLSLAVRGDLAFIRGAGTEFSPRGLRFQHTGFQTEATHILTANATVNMINVLSDLGRLELAIENADVPMLRPTWLFAPRTKKFLENLRDGNGNRVFPEMANGELRGKPFKTTTQIPVNLGGGGNESEIYLVDFAQIVVGEHMGLEIAMTTEGAYVDANAQLQSAFSRDETVMRAIQQHDIGTRHLAAIAVLTAVIWIP